MAGRVHLDLLPGTLLALLAVAAPAAAAPSLELYGTFHAMGVVITLDRADDPDLDASADVAYRPAGGSFRPAFPPVRVSATAFAGSLFWLTPSTGYDVQVTLHDPDGPPLDGQVLAASASTRDEVVLPPPTRRWHVSPGGSGTDCTEPSPCALREALGQVGPGEEVVLSGGVYYDGDLSLPRGGGPGQPVVLRGAPGETAVLDGADPTTLAWTPEGGGVYHATAGAPDTNLVLADGARLYPYRTMAELQSLSWGIPGFYASGFDLWVRLEGGRDPGQASMVVSRQVQAFRVTVANVAFVDLVFRHYGLNSYPKAIYLDGATDALIQGCTFVHNDLGIGIKRETNRTVIQDNEFYDSTFTWPWDAVKADSRLETGGVRFYSPTTGRGTVIRRNVFHDFFDGFGACPADTGGRTNETDVYENLVYNAGDDGMETDGYCSNVRIWRNTFHDVLVGMSLAPVWAGPTYALRNVVHRTGAGNNTWPGNCFKLNSGFDPSGSIYLLHNTCDAARADTSAWLLVNPGAASLVHARNNILAGTRHALSNSNPDFTLDLDGDALYTTQPTGLVRWLGTVHDTLADFQAATGQEPSGMSAEPGFADAGNGDYHLAPASPLIDRGLRIEGINDDFLGAAPEIGAFEYAPAAACDLLKADLTFPPLDPPRVPPWVYTRDCGTESRLADLHTPSIAPGSDLADPLAGPAGLLRLYQTGCSCASRVALTKSQGAGVVHLDLF